MGLFSKLRGELIDIIEWLDESGDTMAYRFERYGNEIKYGARLVVRESQAAVFINEGKLADVFAPGSHALETRNLPILSTLQGWKYGFESPFKAEVYFVSTRQFTDLKWGTKNPVMRRDSEFGPVRLRAFGSYAVRIADAAAFLRQVAATQPRYTAEEITGQLRNLIVARVSDLLGEAAIPILEMAGNYDEFGRFAAERLAADFKDYGMELTKMLVENISLPPAVEEALDKRSSMGIIGNLQAYAQFQSANAMEDAAKNPGGMAAGGMGMGMGFAMANQIGRTVNAAPETPQAPPPVPLFHVAAGGKQAGPFDLEALRQQASTGALSAQSLVWRPGMAQWAPAGEQQELAPLFAPPPPPPAT